MPAYSFQERFIPLILDGSKDHTVRKERAGRSCHARPGETIYLYYGMRTKWCRKIGEATCWATQEIQITDNSIFMAAYSEVGYKSGIGLGGPYWPLLDYTKDFFAWKDGFRPEGSTADHPEGAFDLMLRFWKQTHELPFCGVVIYWKDFKPTK
jgi:hypothetical protein